MKMILSTRLLALAALGWTMFCPSAVLAQTPDEKADTNRFGNHRDQWVEFGKDVELRAADSARVVVVIGGTAKIHGTVDEEVVVIGGNVVIDGRVGGDVVAVMGGAEIGPQAHIGGNLVSVGGTNLMADGGKIDGQIVDVGAGLVPGKFMKLRWLKDWLSQCVFEFRPLSLGGRRVC
jgi:hypothetical protein